MQNDELQELQALSGKAAASKQGGSHSTRVVDNLRLQLNSTTANFKSVLEVRRDALQASEARRNLFASSVAPANQFSTVSFFEDDAPSTSRANACAAGSCLLRAMRVLRVALSPVTCTMPDACMCSQVSRPTTERHRLTPLRKFMTRHSQFKHC